MCEAVTLGGALALGHTCAPQTHDAVYLLCAVVAMVVMVAMSARTR